MPNDYRKHYETNVFCRFWRQLETSKHLHTLADGGYGGAKGSRTPDLLNAIQALSQLSYGPEFMHYHKAYIVFLQVLSVSALLEQRSQVQPTAPCLLLERGKFFRIRHATAALAR